MKYVIIAGEASGDLHASHLIKSLKELDSEFDIRYFGGDLMAKESRRAPDLHYQEMNVMGFSEVFRKLPSLLKNLNKAKRLLRDYRPDALILVDYPGFNLKLAKYAKSIGIPVHYFISPKVWAWKKWRVKSIRKYVDKMYSILPFEVDWYKKHAYAVTYVGNPSVQEVAYSLGHIPPRRHFLERQGLPDDRKIIALLPGSRRGEIRNNLPLMIAAAKRFPEFQYVVAAAPAIPEKFYREIARDPGMKIVYGCTHTLLKYSEAAIVTSGTATLETAIIGTPQVVVYRANGMKLSYKIMEKLLHVDYVSLPNLIVRNSIVPELLLHYCTELNIARALSPLLEMSPQREKQIAGYRNMQRRLGNSVASEYTAELIYDSIHKAIPAAPEIMEGKEEKTEKPDDVRRKRRKPRPSPRPEESADRTDAEEKGPTSGDQKPRKPRRKPKPKSVAENPESPQKEEKPGKAVKPVKRENAAKPDISEKKENVEKASDRPKRRYYRPKRKAGAENPAGGNSAQK